MTKVSKRFFLAPAVARIRVHGGKKDVDSFKNEVCGILGWSTKTWYRVQSVGIVDIGQPQYEAINEVLKKYGITPEQGWGITEAEI